MVKELTVLKWKPLKLQMPQLKYIGLAKGPMREAIRNFQSMSNNPMEDTGECDRLIGGKG